MPVTVDGAWSAGEWSEAPQYIMQNSTGGNIGYIRAKFNSTHLLVIIDSPWDMTPSTVYWHENAWLAFDTAHDGGGAPQTDDYLLHPNGMALVGTGTNWTYTGVGQTTVQAGEGFGMVPLGSSPNSGTPHRITEMAIPLWIIGSPGSTVGFYAMLDDDSTDPDGTGYSPATAYSEWPPLAGGSPGWPGGWGSAPCADPYAWGDLVLSSPPPPPPPPVGGKSAPIIVTIGELATQSALLIALALVIAVVAVSVVYVKHKKKQS